MTDNENAAAPPDEDRLERRCPRLGGQVALRYCMTCGEEDLPCWKIFDCWWEYFDVTAYMKRRLDPARFEALAAARPKPKVAGLIDLIQAAKERTA